MAIKLQSTKDVHTNGFKVLVYGDSGVGKTTLIKTLPKPVIISAESGLMSLKDMDIPYYEITSLNDLYEAYQACVDSDFESIALDSISEIAEVVLSYEKKQTKDGRQAYGAMNDKLADLIRAFRDIKGKNVYMSAKLEKAQDEMGRVLYSPSMPGKTLTQNLPYYFDLVFALRAEKDEDGNIQRALQTDTDGLWRAKSRGLALEFWEPADLGRIISNDKS